MISDAISEAPPKESMQTFTFARSAFVRSGIRYGLIIAICNTLSHFLFWAWQPAYRHTFAYVAGLATWLFAAGFVCGFLWERRARILVSLDSIEARGGLSSKAKLALSTLKITPVQPFLTRTPYYRLQGPNKKDGTIYVYEDLNRLEEFRELLAARTGQEVPPLASQLIVAQR